MRRIQIYDTTLRDGAQAEGISFSLQDKLLIAKRLDEMGFDFIEGGYPASNEKDSAFFARMEGHLLLHSVICAFGMTRRKGLKPEEDPGLECLLNSGAPVITLVGKSSSFQVSEVIRTTLDENLEMIGDTVAFFVGQGKRVFFDAEHFFDGWKADPGYSIRAIRAAAEAGAESVHLCDTNGGSMPEEIAAGVRAVLDAVSVPVGIHAHNDCGLAVANSLAAVDAGASIVQGTVNGFGERCGNANLVTIIANLLTKKNGAYDLLLSDSLSRLTRLSRYVDEVLNVKSSPRQPYVGRGAFTHKGGMHVSGISRNTSSYEHIDPERVGNERHVLVSELSGRSNIAARTEKYGIADNPELLNRILDVVVRKENEGYSFESAEASFDLLVRKSMGIYYPHFERINYHTNAASGANGVIETTASVKLRIGNIIRHEVADGDGPVNALDAAMRKALTSVYPEIRDMSLIDYKVRVLNSEAATAARVRVVIESKDDDEVWGTVGVDENVIEASWIALCDSFEYKLSKMRKENR